MENSFGEDAVYDNPHGMKLNIMRATWKWFVMIGLLLLVSGCGLLISRPVERIAVVENHSPDSILIYSGTESTELKAHRSCEVLITDDIVFVAKTAPFVRYDFVESNHREFVEMNDCFWKNAIETRYLFVINKDGIFIMNDKQDLEKL